MNTPKSLILAAILAGFAGQSLAGSGEVYSWNEPQIQFTQSRAAVAAEAKSANLAGLLKGGEAHAGVDASEAADSKSRVIVQKELNEAIQSGQLNQKALELRG